jgi:hypothetical protein
MQTIFRLPNASVARADCKGKSVADEVAVDQSNYDANPVNE